MVDSRWKVGIVLGFLGLFVSRPAGADVRTNDLIANHMVLQRSARVKIWGTADPGEKVTVTFCGQNASTVTDAEGNWQADLNPLAPGGPFTMTITGKNTLTLHDILVGDVWLASGQSNMWWPVKWCNTARRELNPRSFDSEIHIYRVCRLGTPVPLSDPGGRWVTCSVADLADFSAVGYMFGQDIHKEIGVPVGIIESAYGATYVEGWTSPQVIASDPAYKPILSRWDRTVAQFRNLKAAYLQRYSLWMTTAAQAHAAGKPLPAAPRPPEPDPAVNPWRPGGLYNAMVYPLARYAIKGVIWYQGEQNADRAYQYRTLFTTLIRNWRNTWQAKNLPFLFVQLPNFNNFKKPTPRPGPSTWAELREAQAGALRLPNTAMAVTIDIGDANSIHPKDKIDVANRLALAAEALVYGRKVVYSGPLYDNMSIEGDKVCLKFKFSRDGLTTKNHEPLKGFAIAGADRRFVWAQAKIDGNSVEVWSKDVPRPAAVRYGWADNPVCNLYNKAGLPASPFRTDDWPGVTVNNR